MANTIEWNEALPENTDDASEGALRIREGKKSTREPINRDHVFGNSSDPTADNAYADNTHSGFHRRVTFVNQDSGYNVSSRTSTLNNGTTLKVTELFSSSQSSKHTDGSASDNVLRFQGGAQTSTKEVITDIQTQTLSNKTLASPTFSGSTSGTIKGSDIGEAGTRMASFFTTINASGAVTFTDTLAVTNAITATGGVVGALTGTATNATNITLADESSDTECFVVYSPAATGNQPPKTGTNLKFNSSTGVLTSTKFAGIHEGNVTGDITSSGTSTFNNITATGTLTTDDVTGTADVDLTLTKGSSAKIVLKNAGGVDISGDIVMQSSAGITCGPLSATTVTATGAATLTSISAKGAFSIKDSSDVEKFAIVQASGNTTIAGTLNVTGTITGSLTGNVTGSVSGGDWNGNVISAAKGGTGATSLAGAGLVTSGTGDGSIGTMGVEYSSTAPTGDWNDLTDQQKQDLYMWIRDRGNSLTMGISTFVSDKSLKSNITNSKVNALEALNKVKTRRFNWKNTEHFVDLGLVAQEVSEVIPNAVFEVPQPEKSKLKTLRQIRTEAFIPYLVKAVQELSAEVKALKA